MCMFIDIFVCVCLLLVAFYAERRGKVRLLVVPAFEQELYFLPVLTFAAKQMYIYYVYTYTQLHS